MIKCEYIRFEKPVHSGGPVGIGRTEFMASEYDMYIDGSICTIRSIGGGKRHVYPVTAIAYAVEHVPAVEAVRGRR